MSSVVTESSLIKVALDWTPNTNHIGLYVAKALGLYKEAGLNVQFLNPAADAYKTTPAAKLAAGLAQFAIAPSETVISHATQPGKPLLQAVAAVLQTDTSAIVTLKSSGVDRPAKLDGCTYASYGARYEGRIVQQLIINDGGTGDFTETTPPMLGIWQTLLEGKADATWCFLCWEGVEAEQKGVELNKFKLADASIPYGYTPLLISTQAYLSENQGAAKTFLAATARGYQLAAQEPERAADLFLQQCGADHGAEATPEGQLVKRSMQLLSKHILTQQGTWGDQEAARWDSFLDWLVAKGLLTSGVQSRDPSKGVSLADLRGGQAGEALSRSEVSAGQLFTTAFLPS